MAGALTPICGTQRCPPAKRPGLPAAPPGLSSTRIAICRPDLSYPGLTRASRRSLEEGAGSSPAMTSCRAMTDTGINDPHLWLEDVEGETALDWVREQNARSLALLEADPRYQRLYDATLAIITAEDRIPYPRFLGGALANFWQDSGHVRGLWRRTSLDAYRSPAPEWRTILDLDALAAAEGKNWVMAGTEVLPPDDRSCMIGLSNGGKDAAEVREFDSAAGRFVEGGFFLPEGKQ